MLSKDNMGGVIVVMVENASDVENRALRCHLPFNIDALVLMHKQDGRPVVSSSAKAYLLNIQFLEKMSIARLSLVSQILRDLKCSHRSPSIQRSARVSE